MHFGLGEIYFGRTATHFVHIFIFFTICKKNVCFLSFFINYVVFGLLERYSELGRTKLIAIYNFSAKNNHAMLIL